MNEPTRLAPKPDGKSGYRPSPQRLLRFRQLTALAYFGGHVEDCPVGRCRARNTCCGGPRGEVLRSGIPRCWAGRELPEMFGGSGGKEVNSAGETGLQERLDREERSSGPGQGLAIG